MRKNGTDQFWSKVVKSADCWEWQGGKTHNGYGRFSFGNKTLRAHRVAWELTNGPIPPSTPFVLHDCDNPGCVRPDHLWLGTQADNVRDMHKKHRNIGRAKLTPLQAIEVRALWSTGKWTQAALAEYFNVSDSAIWFLVHNKTWTTEKKSPV